MMQTAPLFYTQCSGTCMLNILCHYLSINISELNYFQTAHKFCKYHEHILHSFAINRGESKKLHSQDMKKRKKRTQSFWYLELSCPTYLPLFSPSDIDMNANCFCVRTRKQTMKAILLLHQKMTVENCCGKNPTAGVLTWKQLTMLQGQKLAALNILL